MNLDIGHKRRNKSSEGLDNKKDHLAEPQPKATSPTTAEHGNSLDDLQSSLHTISHSKRPMRLLLSPAWQEQQKSSSYRTK